MDSLITSLSIKRLSYLILVALAAYLAKSGICSPLSYWLIWTAFMLSLITTGDSFKRRLTMIVITGLTAAFAAFAAGCFSSLLLVLAAYLFIVTVACVSVSLLYPEYFLQSFIVNLFAVLSSGSAMPLAGNVDRLILISIGVAIAVFLQMIFYPYFNRNELRSYIAISLRNLKKLNEEIFSCFLEPEYSDNIYLYERRLHVRKNQFMHSMSRLREITRLTETRLNAAERKSHELLLTNIDLLFANMLDYSQLRRRVTDYTTFSVCIQELTGISQEIDKTLDGVISHAANKKYYPDIKTLTQKINQLENNYHNVLQIASREPLVFLLFIDSLNAFCKKIEEIYSEVLPSSNSFS